MIHYGGNGYAECGESHVTTTWVAADVSCRMCRSWLPIVARDLPSPMQPNPILTAFRDRFSHNPDANTFTPFGFFEAGYLAAKAEKEAEHRSRDCEGIV